MCNFVSGFSQSGHDWIHMTTDETEPNTVQDETQEDQDLAHLSWSKGFDYMSSSYPELVNAPSSIPLSQGVRIISRLSCPSIAYAMFGSLPSVIALVCLLFNGSPNAVNEAAGYSLGISIASLLWGMGLSMSAGMDLDSPNAVLDERWHVCWKLLAKCSCVSFWFFFVILTLLTAVERFLGFPTFLFAKVLGEDTASIATVTVYVSSIGFLANFFFESFHRFLSYQARSDYQVVLVFSTSLLHCVLLVGIVWPAIQAARAAAILYSSISCIRAFALFLFLYVKRFELGWQSGVRVRLIQRERPSIRRRRGVGSPPTGNIGKRRARRIPTRRPDSTEILAALQGSGRSDSLHPDTATLQQETERQKTLDNEPNYLSSGSEPFLQIDVPRENTVEKDTLKEDKADVIFTTFVLPAASPKSSFRGPYGGSTSTQDVRELLTRYDLVEQAPVSQPSDGIQLDAKGEAKKSLLLMSPIKATQQRQRQEAVEPSDASQHASSLFAARRMSRRVARFDAEESQHAPINAAERQETAGQEQEEEPSARPANRTVSRKKTMVSVRSLSVDNSFVLDGWCFPTSSSWHRYWKRQRPRQLRETKDYLRCALPSAFLLSFEYLSFNILIVISSLLGPSSCATLGFIITLNTFLNAVPSAISNCVCDQMHFLLRLDNLNSARSLLRVSLTDHS